MDLLSNNSVLGMPGPNFLVFYGLVALAVIVAASVVIRLDPTSRLPPPRAPAAPDPYEIAYLRGGVGAVIETAIYALKRRGAIEAPSAGRLARVPDRAGAANAIEADVLTEIGGSSTIASVVRSPSLRADVRRACEVFRDRLARQGLLMAPGARPVAYAVGLCAAAALAGLAMLKIDVALSQGRHNIAFLVLETLAALAGLAFSVFGFTRRVANARGRAYLERLQGAYFGGARASPEPSVALVAVGALGFAALEGTADESFARQFRRASGDGGGDGGGGGSCGSGGGGGCGGCGGGD